MQRTFNWRFLREPTTGVKWNLDPSHCSEKCPRRPGAQKPAVAGEAKEAAFRPGCRSTALD